MTGTKAGADRLQEGATAKPLNYNKKGGICIPPVEKLLRLLLNSKKLFRILEVASNCQTHNTLTEQTPKQSSGLTFSELFYFIFKRNNNELNSIIISFAI